MSLDKLHLLPPAVQEVILNGPALRRPGVLSQFENPPTCNTLAIGVSSAMVAISTVVVALRFYVQVFCSKKLHLEDFFAFSAFALSAGYAYCVFQIVTTVGLCVHQWNVRVKDLTLVLYPVHIGSDLYAVIIMAIKVAIILEWKRIFVPCRTRGGFYWTCYGLLVANVVFYTSILIAGNLACTPFRRLWDITTPGRCINRPAIDIVTAATNLFSHLLIFILPQKVIWSLHLPRIKKIGIAVVFAIGLLTCILAGFRVAASVQYLVSDDKTYEISRVALWCHAEITCALMVYCVPAIPKAFAGLPGVLKQLTTYLSSWSTSSPSQGTTEGTGWSGSGSRSEAKEAYPDNKYQRLEGNGIQLKSLPSYRADPDARATRTTIHSSPRPPRGGQTNTRTTELMITVEDRCDENKGFQYPNVYRTDSGDYV